MVLLGGLYVALVLAIVWGFIVFAIGKHAAWETYHSVICRSLPALHYSITASRFTLAQRHTLLLLLKLIASEFRTPEATHLVKQYTSKSIAEIRAHPAQGPLETFLHLLPRPIGDPERQTIALLLAKCRFVSQAGLDATELEFLVARFQGNNHVLSDERLRPIGHAIL